MQGYIKIHRKMLEWEWFNDPNTYRLFNYLLLKANYKPLNFKGLHVDCGQLVTSINSLSVSLRLTSRQIRVSLDKLKMTNELTIKTTNRFTLITIVNWRDYQYEDTNNVKQNVKQNDKQTTNRMTNKRQTNDKQMTTSKEGNKERIKEKEKNIKKENFSSSNFSKKDEANFHNEVLKQEFEELKKLNIEKTLWDEFLKIRKDKGKPTSKIALKIILEKLALFEKNNMGNASLSLKNSITGSYIDVYEPNNENKQVQAGYPTGNLNDRIVSKKKDDLLKDLKGKFKSFIFHGIYKGQDREKAQKLFLACSFLIEKDSEKSLGVKVNDMVSYELLISYAQDIKHYAVKNDMVIDLKMAVEKEKSGVC